MIEMLRRPGTARRVRDSNPGENMMNESLFLRLIPPHRSDIALRCRRRLLLKLAGAIESPPLMHDIGMQRVRAYDLHDRRAGRDFSSTIRRFSVSGKWRRGARAFVALAAAMNSSR